MFQDLTLLFLVVTNPLVHPESEIFLTLRGEEAPRLTWIVAGQQEGRFTIRLSDPAPSDLAFAYWIVNTYATDQSQANVSQGETDSSNASQQPVQGAES